MKKCVVVILSFFLISPAHSQADSSPNDLSDIPSIVGFSLSPILLQKAINDYNFTDKLNGVEIGYGALFEIVITYHYETPDILMIRGLNFIGYGSNASDVLSESYLFPALRQEFELPERNEYLFIRKTDFGLVQERFDTNSLRQTSRSISINKTMLRFQVMDSFSPHDSLMRIATYWTKFYEKNKSQLQEKSIEGRYSDLVMKFNYLALRRNDIEAEIVSLKKKLHYIQNATVASKSLQWIHQEIGKSIKIQYEVNISNLDKASKEIDKSGNRLNKEIEKILSDSKIDKDSVPPTWYQIH